MAKSDIELNIQTKYKDEGIEKVKQGLNAASTQAKRASEAVGKVSSALGGLNNKAGQAANAVAGLLQSFTQGGIWGVAAAGAMLVVNKLIDGFNKAKEASKSAAEFAKKEWQNALANISKNAEIKIKSKVETVEAEAKARSVANEIKDVQEQTEVQKLKEQNAARKMQIKVQQRQGTYTPLNGTAENDIALIDAQEKIDIATISKRARQREIEKRNKEFSDELAKGSETIKQNSSADYKYQDELTALQTRIDQIKKWEEIKRKEDEKNSSQRMFVGGAVSNPLPNRKESNKYAEENGIDPYELQKKMELGYAVGFPFGSAVPSGAALGAGIGNTLTLAGGAVEIAGLQANMAAAGAGIGVANTLAAGVGLGTLMFDETKVEEEKRKNTEKLYGIKVGEKDEDKKERYKRLEEKQRTLRPKVEPIQKQMMEKVNRNQQLVKDEEGAYTYFDQDKDLKKFLTVEEKATKKLSQQNKGKLYEKLAKDTLPLYDKYIELQNEIMYLLGDDSVIKLAIENAIKSRDNIKKIANSSIGSKGVLVNEKNALTEFQSSENINTAVREKKDLQIKMSGGNTISSKEQTNGNITKQEKTKLDIEKAVENKDLKTLGEKKAVEQKKFKEAQKQLEDVDPAKVEANINNAEKQLADIMQKIKPETDIVKFSLEAKIEENNAIEKDVAELQKKLKEATSDEVKASLKVRVDEKMSLKYDNEKVIKDYIGELQKWNGKELVENLVTVINNKIKVNNDMSQVEKAKKELADAKSNLSTIDSGMKQIKEQSKTVSDIKFRDKIEDKQTQVETEEKVSRLEQLDFDAVEQMKTIDSKTSTVKEKTQAAKQLGKINKERTQIRKDLEETQTTDKVILEGKGIEQQKRIREAKSVLYKKDATNEQKDDALKELQDAESKLALIQKTLAEKYKVVADALKADKQKVLNANIEKAQKAIQDWTVNFQNARNINAEKGKGFINADDIAKARREDKRNNVVIGQDANGEDIKISKKQQRAAEINKRELDKLLKIPEKNLSDAQKKKLKERMEFDDLFNPDKIKKRQNDLKAAEKAKDDMMKKEAQDVADIKALLKNLGM